MSELSKNKIKWIRSLERKKIRDELNLFVIEGEKMVNEAMTLYPEFIELLVYTDGFIFTKNIPMESIRVSEKELSSISNLKTANKAIAILRKMATKGTNSKITLVLDSIQDPGNMGTILRTADWFGVDHIVCSKETVDVYNTKVVQASMGAILRVHVEYLDLNNYLSLASTPIYGTLLEGNNVYEEKLSDSGILLMGNEGSGIHPSLKQYITDPISIPRFGGAESLNVGVATGIFLSEFFRNH